jgi:DNA polymerase elongation subunit (family B)
MLVTSNIIMRRKELIQGAHKFVEKVNRQLPGIIELEFRDLYQAGIFVARKDVKVGAKKRYALIDHEGNLEIRGFEVVRRDWCGLAKLIQREVLRIILQERDVEKAVKLVKATLDRIRKGRAKKDELTIYTQLVMPLSRYKAIGPHVRAAMKMRDRGRPVGEGMIIDYIVVRGRGKISDRAEPAEDVEEGAYDPDYYVEHQVLPAAMRVLQALGITEQEVLSGRIQTRLESF